MIYSCEPKKEKGTGTANEKDNQEERRNNK